MRAASTISDWIIHFYYTLFSLCVFFAYILSKYTPVFRAAVKFCRGIKRHRGAREAPVKNLRLITYSGNKSGNYIPSLGPRGRFKLNEFVVRVFLSAWVCRAAIKTGVMGDRPRGDDDDEKGLHQEEVCIIRLYRAQLTRRRHNYPQPKQICAQAKKFQEDKRTKF
jgi:hypothetical protein